MNLKIKLRNKKRCNGCPCLFCNEDERDICFYYTEVRETSFKYKKRKHDKYIKIVSFIKRPKKCIEENGL